MINNKKILIYDLIISALGFVYSWGILILSKFQIIDPYNKIFMLIASIILISIFILNIFCFFITKETAIGVVNILTPMVFSIILIFPCTIMLMDYEGYNLVTIANLYPMVVAARFQYNIGFYFNVKCKRKINNIQNTHMYPPYQNNDMGFEKLVSKIFTIFPTIVLTLIIICVLVMIFI